MKTDIAKKILSCFLAVLMLFCIMPDKVFAANISVSAKSAILIEKSSGKIIWQKNAKDQRKIASTTKIMTAICALENAPLSKVIATPKEATLTEGTKSYLASGERAYLSDMLYMLLLESANDAAVAIAGDISGSCDGFSDLMNEKAREIGLADTNFENPHGLDTKSNYSCALDLAKLCSYALDNAEFAKIVSTRTYKSTTLDGVTRNLKNHNRLLSLYKGAIGVKTGYTKSSGRCLVSAAEKDGTTLICVTLDDPDDWNDHIKLFDYGFAHTEKITLQKGKETVFSVPVVGGKCDRVGAVLQTDMNAVLVLPRGNITQKIFMPQFLYAPIEKGEKIGKIIFCCDGEEIACASLFAQDRVARKKPENIFVKLFNFIFRR